MARWSADKAASANGLMLITPAGKTLKKSDFSFESGESGACFDVISHRVLELVNALLHGLEAFDGAHKELLDLAADCLEAYGAPVVHLP